MATQKLAAANPLPMTTAHRPGLLLRLVTAMGYASLHSIELIASVSGTTLQWKP
jgi:hypothetical protein